MKIGIIGSGFVGSTAAFAMVMRGVGREIVLVDLNRQRAEAEASDLLHAVPFAHPMEVYAGDYSDLDGAKVVILTAGVSQKPGETRLELLERNARVFEHIVPRVLENAPAAILLVATNPVDVMTHLAAYYARRLGVPSSRVIGSGTSLDTARFRSLLGQRLIVDPQHIHAYVLGEHGDSEVLTWSMVSVGGLPLDDFCEARNLSVCSEDRMLIDDLVRHAAYQIIEGKGSTYYGIGSALARICEVILRDQDAILTLCTPLEEVESVKDVTVSMPHLVGGTGILATLHPKMDSVEHQALQASAALIRSQISQLGIG